MGPYATAWPGQLITPFLRGEFVVDHTSYDMMSILATLEMRYGLQPLGSREAAVNDLSHIFDGQD